MINPKAILSLPMSENDAEVSTVGEYFVKLLVMLWEEGEGFSSKRPFGNSGWQHELYQPLCAAGLIGGYIDEDGYANDYDTALADTLITAAIMSMGWSGTVRENKE
jgi:hypothetical protein